MDGGEDEVPSGWMEMKKSGPVEIVCPQCGEDAILIREAVYEGFKKVGELRKCSNCGYGYGDEEEPEFKERKPPDVFDESDRPEVLELFDQSEYGILCRYCRHYVVNPFTQWCGLHRREVAATDTCDDFEKKPLGEQRGGDGAEAEST